MQVNQTFFQHFVLVLTNVCKCSKKKSTDAHATARSRKLFDRKHMTLPPPCPTGRTYKSFPTIVRQTGHLFLSTGWNRYIDLLQ